MTPILLQPEVHLLLDVPFDDPRIERRSLWPISQTVFRTGFKVKVALLAVFRYGGDDHTSAGSNRWKETALSENNQLGSVM